MADLDALTSRQRDIYNFIRSKIQGRGYGPTVREIGVHFQIKSPNGVMCHLKALQKKGLIHREPNMSRAIQLLREIALMGRVGFEQRGVKLGQPAVVGLQHGFEKRRRIARAGAGQFAPEFLRSSAARGGCK